MLKQIILHKPIRVLKLVKRGFKKSFSQHLLLTNVTISFSLSAVGDIIQQHYRINCKEQQQSWDRPRTQNMTCSGVTVGILCHYWYQILDRRLPGRATKTVFTKVFMDQVIFSPICILVFISTLSCLNGINHYIDNYENDNSDNINNNNDNRLIDLCKLKYNQFKEDINDKGLRLYIADWVVWPPAQFINFYFLPTRYRVLYDNTISLLYDVYSSHVMYTENSVSDNDVDKEGL